MSVMVALFTISARSTTSFSSHVGVGAAATSWASTGITVERIENFILREVSYLAKIQLWSKHLTKENAWPFYKNFFCRGRRRDLPRMLGMTRDGKSFPCRSFFATVEDQSTCFFDKNGDADAENCAMKRFHEWKLSLGDAETMPFVRFRAFRLVRENAKKTAKRIRDPHDLLSSFSRWNK
jgi:hypothetical protein